MKKLIVLIALFAGVLLGSCKAENISQTDVNHLNEIQEINEIEKEIEPTTKVKVPILPIVEIVSEESMYSLKFDVDMLSPNISQFMTWPNLQGDKVAFASYNITEKEPKLIHYYDINTKEDSILYNLDQSENHCIEDVKISGDYIFWIEGNWDEYTTPEGIYWEIKRMDIQSGVIETIRCSNELNEPTLVPRLDEDQGYIVWTEGDSQSDDSIEHTIFVYDNADEKYYEIDKLNIFKNPYDIIRIRDGVITYPDQIDGEWYIKCKSINGEINWSKKMDYLPMRPVSNGRILLWSEMHTHKELYYYDIENDEEIRLDEQVFLFDVAGDIPIYSKSDQNHHLYMFDRPAMISNCITAKYNFDRNYFDFTSYDNNRVISVYDGLEGASQISVIELKSDQ